MINRLQKGETELVLKTSPQSYAAETIRMLSNSIQFSRKDSVIRTLLVTSPSGWEGKSFITANLALAFAKAGLRVVLVDADLRRPRQHQIFELKQGSGLSEALYSGNINGRLKSTRINNLRLMTSGRITKRPTDRIASPQFRMLLEELKKEADIVLIDCPPVLPVADAILMSPFVDNVLVVIRANRTKRANAQRAVESLRRVNANLLGAVLNDVPMSDQETSTYYYIDKPKKKDIRRLFSKKKDKVPTPPIQSIIPNQESPKTETEPTQEIIRQSETSSNEEKS